jgi:general secretion pathway protein G
MKLQPPGHAGRRGFTLIELLVVIAIIAILIGLLLAGVIPLLNKGPALRDRADLSQLDVALKEKFYAKYKFYPPSLLFLANNRALYKDQINALHQASLQYLNRMFPKLDWSGASGPIDWSGGLNKALLDTQGVILQGDQCLVFFLGGIPTTGNGSNATLGFSTNQRNPSLLGGETFKFYEFQSPRLQALYANNPFFSFMNSHDPPKPYAYFSSYNKTNGYNPFGTVDCAPLGVQPYYSATTPAPAYYNPNAFQIVSAGADGQFGPGGQWTPANAGSTPQAGLDDISNFYPERLGVSP